MKKRIRKFVRNTATKLRIKLARKKQIRQLRQRHKQFLNEIEKVSKKIGRIEQLNNRKRILIKGRKHEPEKISGRFRLRARIQLINAIDKEIDSVGDLGKLEKTAEKLENQRSKIVKKLSRLTKNK